MCAYLTAQGNLWACQQDNMLCDLFLNKRDFKYDNFYLNHPCICTLPKSGVGV